MTADARNKDGANIAPVACGHGPDHIAEIENVHILVHQHHMLELGKRPRRPAGRPAADGPHRWPDFFHLDDRQVFAGAGGRAVHVQDKAGQRTFNQLQNTGFRGDPGHVGVLVAGADARLQDRMAAVGDGFDFNHRDPRLRLAGISREFRHGLPAVGMLIFPDPVVREQFALDHHLGTGNRARLHGQTVHQLHGLLAQAARHRQLVIADRGGGRFKTGTDFDGRIHPDTDGDGQGKPGIFCLLTERIQMAARDEVHGNLVPALHAEAVDSDVVFTGLRIGGIAHPQRKIGPASSGVLVGAGRILSMLKSGSVARCTTS